MLALLMGVSVTITLAWYVALRPTGGVTWGVYTHAGDRFSSPDLYIMEERRPGLRTFHIASSESGSSGSIGPAWQFRSNPISGTPIWTLRRADTAVVMARSKESRPKQVTAEPPPGEAGWPAWLPPIPDEPAGLVGYGGRAAGWPWATMRSLVRVDPATRVPRWRGRLRLRPESFYGARRLNLQDPESGCVPLLPIAEGFTLSTLMWATPCFLVLAAPGLVRRRLRASRGRCTRCGYDLRGTGAGLCPECGASNTATALRGRG